MDKDPTIHNNDVDTSKLDNNMRVMDNTSNNQGTKDPTKDHNTNRYRLQLKLMGNNSRNIFYMMDNRRNNNFLRFHYFRSKNQNRHRKNILHLHTDHQHIHQKVYLILLHNHNTVGFLRDSSCHNHLLKQLEYNIPLS